MGPALHARFVEAGAIAAERARRWPRLAAAEAVLDVAAMAGTRRMCGREDGTSNTHAHYPDLDDTASSLMRWTGRNRSILTAAE